MATEAQWCRILTHTCQGLPIALVDNGCLLHLVGHTASHLRRKMPPLSILLTLPPSPSPSKGLPSSREAQPHPIAKGQKSVGLWLHLLVVLGTEAAKTVLMRRKLRII